MYRQLLVKLFGAAYAGAYRYLAFSTEDEKRMLSFLVIDCENLLDTREKELFFGCYGINKNGEPIIIPDANQEISLNEIHNKLIKSNFVKLFKEYASSSKITSGHSPESVTEIIFKVEEEILC
ncbi:hypothetical protein KKC17_03815 [Patescibacteria group bacterium]|nr:hypothetical protein [Patescibacteria group bacterium]